MDHGSRLAGLRAGLAANGLALAGGLALVLAILFLPDTALRPAGPAARTGVDLAHARITAIRSTSDPATPPATVEILDGPRRGTSVDAYLQGPAGQVSSPAYAVGEEVVVSISVQDATTIVAVSDRWRLPLLLGVTVLFAVAVIAVGGWRGLRSLIALALTLAAVVKIVLPLLLAGWAPIPVAIGTATLVSTATFTLTEGFRRSTAAALAGTFLALGLVGVIAAVLSAATRFTGVQGQEELGFLQSLLGEGFDLSGLLLAAIILGSLGVLDDVTVAQAATVTEIHRADPGAGAGLLFRRAMNVGRAHIAATVNTLVLAYVGAALPLLVLFAVGQQNPAVVASTEQVAVEIVRALAGSIGIVAAVPITTGLAVALERTARRP